MYPNKSKMYVYQHNVIYDINKSVLLVHATSFLQSKEMSNK